MKLWKDFSMICKPMESRVEKAVELFHSGYNCSQAVVGAYADLFGLDTETALRLSASFGGGMGRMRLVCGAVSGMMMVNGLANGSADAGDQEAKKANYAKVQYLANLFREQNGSIICRELLEGSGNQASTHADPSARTAEYYRKRPCAEYVRCCAQLVENEILNK